MGAKQSKRSVDISGKEAESAGEVAAAGAGGEGRVEQLADADALKPQLNGDAHIHEKSEKEKELDDGTPENEKDATTEKEDKEEKEKEAVATTNGETEQKTDNSDSAPTPEEGKKPKKEKVKKKWSLRSISFSRKDKPKQEKKQKDEEPKTNGEPEKVPEETAEATTTPEVVINEVPADKTDTETNEKTPETPVTEPITNGSSTPETPKAELEEPVKTIIENDKPEPKVEPEPVQLPVNGLSLEEHKTETPDAEINIADSVENKVEEQAVEKTPEIAPTPEILVKEVCVDQMPLIEPTPPPLPANPPPSSVASFAATTMAPELADASLPNTAENAIPVSPPTAALKSDELLVDPTIILTTTNDEIVTDLTAPIKDIENDVVEMQIDKPEVLDDIPSVELSGVTESESKTLISEDNGNSDCGRQSLESVSNPDNDHVVQSEIDNSKTDVVDLTPTPIDEPCQIAKEEVSLPPPDDNLQKVDEDPIEVLEVQVGINGPEINSNHTISDNDTTEILDQEMNVQPPEERLDNTKDLIENLSEVAECNGNVEEHEDRRHTEENAIETTVAAGTVIGTDKDSVTEEEELPAPMPASQPGEEEAGAPLTPPPPSPMDPPQEPIPVCDKMADLIPDIPDVPELKTETLQETSTDVAVAN